MQAMEQPPNAPRSACRPPPAAPQEQERLLRDKERADAKATKERERELARLEAERRKHLDRVMKEQVRACFARCAPAVHAVHAAPPLRPCCGVRVRGRHANRSSPSPALA